MAIRATAGRIVSGSLGGSGALNLLAVGPIVGGGAPLVSARGKPTGEPVLYLQICSGSVTSATILGPNRGSRSNEVLPHSEPNGDSISKLSSPAAFSSDACAGG